jgi:hypothetical protein
MRKLRIILKKYSDKESTKMTAVPKGSQFRT